MNRISGTADHPRVRDPKLWFTASHSCMKYVTERKWQDKSIRTTRCVRAVETGRNRFAKEKTGIPIRLSEVWSGSQPNTERTFC